MPIVSSDIQYRYSGGASNAVAASSLGGTKSSVTITSAVVANLFDNVSGDEAAAGTIEYRAFFVHNGHATLTLQGAKAWLVSNTPSADTTCDIAVGTGTVTGTEQTIVNETTAPVGVTFSAPASKAAGLTVGDLAPGQHKAIWVRRTISAGAGAYNSDNVVVRIEGDTAA